MACLLGTGAFYAIGSVAMDSWGQTVIATFSSEQGFKDLTKGLNEHGFLLILLTGITPIPFQIAMLAAGAVDYSFAMFMAAAALARGLRYFGLAFLVIKYGDRAAEVWPVVGVIHPPTERGSGHERGSDRVSPSAVQPFRPVMPRLPFESGDESPRLRQSTSTKNRVEPTGRDYD